MILVCGATGTIGNRVVSELAKSNARVRALIREQKGGSGSQSNGVEQIAGDLAKPDTLGPALDAVEAAFLLSPIGSQQAQMEQNLISAAVAKGVQRIVKLSALGASSKAPFEFARMHGQAEDAIRSSGLQWTFVRANMFMQNLRWYKGAIAQGTLPLALGDAPVSHVDAEDVAAVAAQTLLSDTHASKTYTVTGPAALTGEQVASILSQSLGKRVTYAPISNSDFREFLKGTGDPEFVINAECELFEHWSRGEGQMVSNDVEQVLGRKAVDLKTFLARNATEFSQS